MKNITKQDLYLYEQVETVLRASVPQISKNIHEAFRTKPTEPGLIGGAKRLIDRTSLKAQELFHTGKAALYQSLRDKAEQVRAQKKEVSGGRINAAIGRELGMKPEEINLILGGRKRHPGAGPERFLPDPITGAKTLANPHYAYELERHEQNVKSYQRRQKLLGRMAAIKKTNPFLGAADTQVKKEIAGVGEFAKALERRIPQAQAKAQQLRRERIIRGYTT